MASSETQDNATSHPSKQFVEQSYDAMAPQYLEWTSRFPSARTTYIARLLPLIPQDSPILELGCGAGVPGTEMLAKHSSNVTANDISGAQIELAKQHVPGVKFVKGDMMGLEFGEGSFDAVAAFYSVIHLPRDEQAVMLKRIWGWLKDGGYLLVNLGTRDSAEMVNNDWLGTKMYWSSFDADKNREMVIQTGFSILVAEVVEQEEEPGQFVPFLWILAKKGAAEKEN